MESARLNECPLHGAGLSPDHLVGQRLEGIVASWHRQDGEASSCPLDVWLIDGNGIATRVTAGSDWCLIVERSAPYEGFDMEGAGRVEVAPVHDETPFTAHLGETVLAVREEADAVTGRLALDITFESGRLRCQSWAGELRLSTC